MRARKGHSAASSWHWEVRSVNGRGLDVRLRLPPGTEHLEPKVREVVGRHLTRGSVTVSLQRRDAATAAQEIRLNERGAGAGHEGGRAHRARLTDAAPPRADGLITIKGVLEVVERQEERRAGGRTRRRPCSKALEQAPAWRSSPRAPPKARGSRRRSTPSSTRSSAWSRIVRGFARAHTRGHRARLKEQVARLMDAANGFDPARLHQEAVLLATRADVEEELQRLQLAHRRRARAAGRGGRRRAASSTSSPRNSTARPTRCAPRRTTWRSRAPASP